MASEPGREVSGGKPLVGSVERRRERRKMVATTGISTEPHWKNEHDAFEYLSQFEKDSDKVFFDKVEIALDGGLSDIEEKKEHIWSRGRYFGSTLLAAFVVYNTYFILSTNIASIRSTEECVHNVTGTEGNCSQTQKPYFLLSPVVFSHTINLLEVLTGHTIRGDQIAHHATIFAELLLLGRLLVMVLVDLLEILIREKRGFKRWFAVSHLCTELLPEISCFSAMKLLHFVSKKTIIQEFMSALIYHEKPKWHVLWIVIRTPLYFVIGFDAFLIRYRDVSQNVLQDKPSLTHLLAAGMFLNQVLGVIQVDWAVKDRLLRFTFAGEDGVMTAPEHVRMRVWQAMVAERIFKLYERQQAIAVLLSWSDDDMQFLVLNDLKVGRQSVARFSQVLEMESLGVKAEGDNAN